MLNYDDDFNIQSTCIGERYVCTVLYESITYIVDTTAFELLFGYVHDFCKYMTSPEKSTIKLGYDIEETSVLTLKISEKQIFVEQSHNGNIQQIFLYDLLRIMSEIGYLLSRVTCEYLVDLDVIKIGSFGQTCYLPVSICDSLMRSFFKSYNTTFIQLSEGPLRVKVFNGLATIYTLEKTLLSGLPFHLLLSLCMRVVLERNCRNTSYIANPSSVKWKYSDKKFMLRINDWFSLTFSQDFIPTLEEFVFKDPSGEFLPVVGGCYLNVPCFLRRTRECIYIYANNIFHLICAVPVSVFKECLLCYIDNVIVPIEKYSLANGAINSVHLLGHNDVVSLEVKGCCVFTFTRNVYNKILGAFNSKVPAIVFNVNYLGSSTLCRVVKVNGGVQLRLPDYPHVRYYISDYNLSNIL